MSMREEQARFFGKVATLMQAEIPIFKAMEVAGERIRSEELKEALARIVDRTYGGMSFVEAFTAEASLFSPEILCLIEQGEKAGDLEAKAAAIAAGLHRGDLEAGEGGGEGRGEPALAWLLEQREQGAVAVHVDPGPVVRVRDERGGPLREVAAPPGIADLAPGALEQAGIGVSEAPFEDGPGRVLRLDTPNASAPLLAAELTSETAAALERLLSGGTGLLLVAGPDREERADVLVALGRAYPGAGRKAAAPGSVAGAHILGARRMKAPGPDEIRSLQFQDLDSLWLDDLLPVAHTVLRSMCQESLVVAGLQAVSPEAALAELVTPAGGALRLGEALAGVLWVPEKKLISQEGAAALIGK